MILAPIVYFDGGLNDAMGGPSATFHRDAASSSAPGVAAGAPLEAGDGALRFNGDDTFAYLPHAEKLEVQNGTIALWVRPEQLDGRQIFVSKDEEGQGAGGHFYIGMEDGRLQARVMPGDGDWHPTFETKDAVFSAGAWTHIAVSFGADGLHIYVDGQALRPNDFAADPGETVDPATYVEAHLLTNDKPIVLGAGTMWSDDTSSVAALLNDGPYAHFNGDIDGFGVWGGTSPLDALSSDDIAALASGDPISFLPTPPTPIDRSDDTLIGSAGVDILDGGYGDDIIDGGDGIDDLRGGYGDDRLLGGAGADILDGGRGNDWLDGGDGDDLLILGADAGEPRLGQQYDPAENPDGELNPETLTVFEGHPLLGDDIAIGGAGADTFVLQPALNAKREIILKHMNDDRSINWRGVAGENDEHHDHWPDSIGVDIIADFNKSEGDRIFIDGHTANIDVKGGGIRYDDVNNDGVEESIITIVSNQPNGGAHDRDLLGRVTVFGDRVERDDIDVNAGSVAGIIDTVEDLDEAIAPEGTPDANPNRVLSRSPFRNDVDYAALNAEATPNYQENIRAVETAAGFDDVVNGTDSADTLLGDPMSSAESGVPHPPISYFTFDELVSGTVADSRDVETMGYFKAIDAKAVLQSGPGEVPTEAGAPGLDGRAIRFEDDDAFAVVAHNAAYEVLQGTVALWFKSDDVDDGDQTLLAKDASGRGDGGHMRIMIVEGGQLLVRMAPGDGGNNREWISNQPIVESGEWSHVAVGFGQDGIEVWFDGRRLPDSAFSPVEEEGVALSQYKEFFLVENQQPWVLGADTHATPDASSAAIIAGEDRLRNEFKGAIDGFGVWGGLNAADGLNNAQVASLVANGPGDLDAPARQAAPIPVGDDDIRGFGGDDIIDAGAGRDVVDGGTGADRIDGGYGADRLFGGGGDDYLDGGHGNDVLIGGGGDDILMSRSDAREGPVRLDPNRDEGDPYYELSPTNGQVYGSQPIAGNDVLTGGDGADTFRFETLINTKERFFLDHVMENGMIHWHGVAGENDNIHDHWVDMIGDDVITDFSIADGDKIEIVGHTTEILNVEYVDIDGDLQADATLISIYSQQGKGGGAHDEDRLGTITVYGDLVEEDDIFTDAGPAYGIVDTVWELADAVTPLDAADEQARGGFSSASAGPVESLGPIAPSTPEPTPIPAPTPTPTPTATPTPTSPPVSLYTSASPFDDRDFRLMVGDMDDDTIRGGAQRDEIAGRGGDDRLYGGGSRDKITGGDGRDVVMGEDGADILGGGLGDDEIRGGTGGDRLSGGDGQDMLYGDGGDDVLGGGSGDDMMYGGAGIDHMIGADGDDFISGGAGDDVLRAGEGEDRLHGGAGDDFISANGADANTLVYDDDNFGDDTVASYTAGVDRFEVDASLAARFEDISLELVDGQHTKITFDGASGSITVEGVQANAFTADDFVIVGGVPSSSPLDDDEPVAASAAADAEIATAAAVSSGPMLEDFDLGASANDDALVV